VSAAPDVADAVRRVMCNVDKQVLNRQGWLFSPSSCGSDTGMAELQRALGFQEAGAIGIAAIIGTGSDHFDSILFTGREQHFPR
jgi:hypothetical protein